MEFYDYLIDEYGYNKPIILKEIEYKELSRTAIRLKLKRLMAKGIIKREIQGTYYIPKEELGTKGYCSSNDIIRKKYISDGNNTYGFYSCLSLLNGTGFTTQVPNVLTIITNNCNTNKREIEINKFKYILKKSKVEINSDNVFNLEFLELLRILDEKQFEKDKDNKFKNIKYLLDNNSIKLDEAKQYLYYYPAKVAKRFMEVENEIARGKRNI